MSAVMRDVPKRPTPSGPVLATMPAKFNESSPDFWTAGLDILIHEMNHPEELFGAPADRAALSRYGSIHSGTVEEFRDYFRRHEQRCMDGYAMLRVAGGVLSMSRMKACRGPLEARIWYDDADDCHIQVFVSVDADAMQVEQLNRDLIRRSVAAGLTIGYLDVSYVSVLEPEPPGRTGHLELDMDRCGESNHGD